MQAFLERAGVLAPLVFMAIQAVQVGISSVDNETSVLRKARNAFGVPNAFSG